MMKKEALRRGMSRQTIKTYCYNVKQFMKFCDKHPKKVTKKDIRDYLDYLADKNMSYSTLNVALCSLKFLYGQILFKNWRINIKYAKLPKRLPIVLSKKEIKILLDSIENEKHWLIVALMYSAGLRLSEIVNLKVENLDVERGYGWVRQGKGRKDRMFIIADKLKKPIMNFADRGYVFKGRNGHISRKTVYKIVKDNAKKTGINKNVHPHTLRHSFATHLIESNYPTEVVQRLLGHNDPGTTHRYIHVAVPRIQVRSPLDDL